MYPRDIRNKCANDNVFVHLSSNTRTNWILRNLSRMIFGAATLVLTILCIGLCGVTPQRRRLPGSQPRATDGDKTISDQLKEEEEALAYFHKSSAFKETILQIIDEFQSAGSKSINKFHDMYNMMVSKSKEGYLAEIRGNYEDNGKLEKFLLKKNKLIRDYDLKALEAQFLAYSGLKEAYGKQLRKIDNLYKAGLALGTTLMKNGWFTGVDTDKDAEELQAEYPATFIATVIAMQSQSEYEVGIPDNVYNANWNKNSDVWDVYFWPQFAGTQMWHITNTDRIVALKKRAFRKAEHIVGELDDELQDIVYDIYSAAFDEHAMECKFNISVEKMVEYFETGIWQKPSFINKLSLLARVPEAKRRIFAIPCGCKVRARSRCDKCKGTGWSAFKGIAVLKK